MYDFDIIGMFERRLSQTANEIMDNQGVSEKLTFLATKEPLLVLPFVHTFKHALLKGRGVELARETTKGHCCKSSIYH